MANLYLVDDHEMLREGLRKVLENAGHQVVGEADNPDAAVAELAQLGSTITILDLHLNRRSGSEVLEQVRARELDTRVIVMTMSSNPREVAAAMRLGAFGYVLKASATEELLHAVEAVANGRKYLCFRASELAVEGVMAGFESISLRTLSFREMQVVKMVVQGRTSAAISEELRISPKTVESYRSRVMSKLGVSDVPALVRLAIREKLISAED